MLDNASALTFLYLSHVRGAQILLRFAYFSGEKHILFLLTRSRTQENQEKTKKISICSFHQRKFVL